jgi:hypothetical protein
LDFNGTGDVLLWDDSLVVAFNFDNVSALGENNTHVFDVSGNGNNGTVTNALPTSSGKYNGAYDFDGVSDSINVSMAEDVSGDYATSVWFTQEYNNDNNNYYKIYLKWDGTDGHWIQIRETSEDQLHCGLTNSGAAEWAQHNQELSDGEWHHLVCNFDDSANLMMLWLDGVNEANDSTTKTAMLIVRPTYPKRTLVS